MKAARAFSVGQPEPENQDENIAVEQPQHHQQHKASRLYSLKVPKPASLEYFHLQPNLSVSCVYDMQVDRTQSTKVEDARTRQTGLSAAVFCLRTLDGVSLCAR